MKYIPSFHHTYPGINYIPKQRVIDGTKNWHITQTLVYLGPECINIGQVGETGYRLTETGIDTSSFGTLH